MTVSDFEMVFATVHILPPYSSDVLQQLASFVKNLLPIRMIIIGDFSNIDDLGRERFLSSQAPLDDNLSHLG